MAMDDSAPAATAADRPATDAADVATALPPAAIAPADAMAAAPPADLAASDTVAQRETESGRDALSDKSPAAPQCFSIGPFETLDDVRRTSALIESSLQRKQAIGRASGSEGGCQCVYISVVAVS